MRPGWSGYVEAGQGQGPTLLMASEKKAYALSDRGTFASMAKKLSLIVLVEGDHDLLGDGSVELLSTPGHTPGHQSVRVGEDLIIGADVTHFASGLDDHRLPIFGDDLDVQLASAERLRGLRDAGAAVRPGHDPDVLVPGPVLG